MGKPLHSWDEQLCGKCELCPLKTSNVLSQTADFAVELFGAVYWTH